MTSAVRALIPGAAALGIAVVFMAIESDPVVVVDVVRRYGLVVYGAGLALAWVFHRSRAFVVLCALALVQIAVVGKVDQVESILALGTILLGLFGVLGVIRDRGVLSRVGSLQLMATGACAAIVAAIFTNPERVARLAADPNILPFEVVVWPGYPVVTLGTAAFSACSVAYGLFRYRGPIERSFVWAVILLMVAMHPAAGIDGSALFLMTTGLVITLGVVETSYVMAYRDELTGLPGRRALMQYLDGIGGTYTVAMADIDHFKKFNDKHGHDVGDQVLQLVASRLARVPGGGKAYRYGGEEFTLIFPGRAREDALRHLEAVRASVEDARFSLRSWKRPRKKPGGGAGAKSGAARTLSVTVSMGLADTTGKDAAPAAILKKADQALYRAKKKGRNRVSK